MTAHRRAGDTEDHEHERAGNGIEIHGPKDTGLRAEGPNGLLVAVVVVVVLAGSGVMFWIVNTNRQEHRDLKLAVDRMTCVQTLTPEEQRQFRKNWHPGIASSYCPWVEAR